MELWELNCREQVRDVVARYATYVDSGKFDQMMPLFHERATFLLDGRTYEGREEIMSIFTGAAVTLGERAGPGGLIRHMITTHEIDQVTETTARSRCYFLAVVGSRPDHWGRYLDDFINDGGNWQIQRRRVLVDGHLDLGATP